jgi:hypothetical protein
MHHVMKLDRIVWLPYDHVVRNSDHKYRGAAMSEAVVDGPENDHAEAWWFLDTLVVELKFGRTTRGGALDMQAMATITRDELAGMVAEVRAAKPDIAVGLFLLIAAGDDPSVQAISDALGDNLCGTFVGEPKAVLDNLRGLEELGISRIQLTELVPGSIDRLAEVLHD